MGALGSGLGGDPLSVGVALLLRRAHGRVRRVLFGTLGGRSCLDLALDLSLCSLRLATGFGLGSLGVATGGGFCGLACGARGCDPLHRGDGLAIFNIYKHGHKT